MKSIITTLTASLLLVLITACGVEGEQSTVSAVAAAPNLKPSAPNFKCGDNVVVIVITNDGNADARSSFFRVNQSNAPSQAFLVKALKAGETASRGIVVKYKNGQLDATISADSNGKVAESNEHDNTLRLVCE